MPRLPPRLDGIGDYSLRLAERLRTNHDIHTSFLVADPGWVGERESEGFPVRKLVARSRMELSKELDFCMASDVPGSMPILLQFAPYGYAVRGCPLWLVQGLREWTLRRSVPLMTMFHELNAGAGRPWSSTFWLSPVQRILIRQLARMSRFCLTNTQFHRRKLMDWGMTDIPLLPSFSTIGEPVTNVPVRERRRQLVVFGRPWQRQLAYTEGASALGSVCEQVAAERIIDIGDPIQGDVRSDVGGVPLVRCGSLPAAEVSHWMHSSLASFLFYPDALLTKSTIYAATCAHGTIPFVASNCEEALQETELSQGKDYISLRAGGLQADPNEWQQLSTTVFERYQERNSSASAKQIASRMLALQTSCVGRA